MGSTGFIGSNFASMYPNECIYIDRSEREPRTKDVLYLISTTDNYNVFSDPTLDVQTNLVVFTQFLNECKKKKDITINFISSWFVYGSCEYLPVKESFTKKPKGFYSITKSCAEDLLISFCETFKIKYRIFRLGNVYGAGDCGVSQKKNALQYCAEQIKNDQDLMLNYGGNFIRDYLHVKDVCRAIHHLIHNGNENQIYNVGSGDAYRFIDLIEMMYKISGKQKKIINTKPSETDKIIQVKDMCLDVMKLRMSGFDFSQNIKIEDGIASLFSGRY